MNEKTIKSNRVSPYALPHRKPMLLIDRVIDVDSQNSICEMDLPADAFFFQGHFPDRPVMPGVMIIEACAQTAALILGIDDFSAVDFSLSSVDKAKFILPVLPGNKLRLEATLLKSRQDFYWFDVCAFVSDLCCTKVRISIYCHHKDLL